MASIVDYLRGQGQDSSFANRSKLASQYGIGNYSGTANQNISLLNKLKSGSSGTATAPKAKTTITAGSNVQQRVTNLNNQYKNSQERTNAVKWQNATIEDIAKKYGFDYSRDYANRQAESIAQEKRNAYNDSSRRNETLNQETLQQIDNSIRESNAGLDHQYFQQGLTQEQDLIDRGLNAGLAQDAMLRLNMNRQAQLADVYKDANLARTQESNRFNNESLRLSEALALVEQQKLAQADEMYQQLRQMGYENLTNERGYYSDLDQNTWQRIQQQIAREYDLDQQAWQRRQAEAEFAWQKQMDQARLAASRSGSSSGSSSSRASSGSSSSASGSLSSAYREYQQQKKTGGSTPEDRYYENEVAKRNGNIPSQDPRLGSSMKQALGIRPYNPTGSRLIDMLNGF